MNKRFSIRTLVSSGLALSLFTFSAAIANGQIIINDSFDDGDLATNTNGIGSGFAFTTNREGTSTETVDGFASVASNDNGGAQASLASNDTVDLTNGASFLFEDVNFAIAADNATGGNTNRTYLGIRGAAGAANAQQNPGEGLYLQFFDDEVLVGDTTTGSDNINSLIYIDALGGRTLIEEFSFDSINTTPESVDNTPFDVLITLDGADYTLDIAGVLGNTVDPDNTDPDNAVGGGEPLSFSGTLDSAPSFTDATIFAFNQSEQPSLDLRIGRIEASVAAVPEPTSVMLLGLGSIAVLARRKRS